MVVNSCLACSTPTIEIRSPGLERSTMSPCSIPSTLLGSCPGGSSSGFSWRDISCQSTNDDSSVMSLKKPFLAQSWFAHCGGGMSMLPAWSMSIFSPQRGHWNIALLSSCLTADARVMIPSTIISLPMWWDLSVLSGVTSSSFLNLALKDFTLPAYCMFSTRMASPIALLSFGTISIGFSFRSCARSGS